MKLILDLLSGLFDKSLKKTPKVYITLEDWITSSGKYKDRAKSPELTDEVKKNAEGLVSKVNALFNELEYDGNLIVSSGYRTSAVNSSIVNAAKKSGHLIGKSIDLVDTEGKLDDLIEKSEVLLKKYSLWQEHPSKTIQWLHLDYVSREERVRPGCNSRQFLPLRS